MNIGLTPNQALNILSDNPNPVWNSPSAIERKVYQNQAIAITAGAVTGVAVAALFLFVMLYYVLIPAGKQVPNPDYDPSYVAPEKGTLNRRTDFTKLDKTIRKNETAYLIGVEGTVFGAVILPIAFGFASGYAVYKSLERARIQPLRELKKELEKSYDATDGSRDLAIGNHNQLVTLIDQIDDRGRKEMLGQMNFEQLTVAKASLGERRFSGLISSLHQDDCAKWKRILEFSKQNGSGKQKAIESNQPLQQMIQDSPETLPHLRLALYREENLSLRAQGIKSFDAAVGTPSLQGEEKASKILRGELALPKTLPELEELAIEAARINRDDLTSLVSRVVFFQARRKKIGKDEMLKFVATYVPDDQNDCFHLRGQAIRAAGFKKVTSLEQFTKMWPIGKSYKPVETLCLDYYKELLKNPKLVRVLYEKAKELQSDALENLCFDHVKGESKEYRFAVEGLYTITDSIPDDLQTCLV